MVYGGTVLVDQLQYRSETVIEDNDLQATRPNL